MSKDFTPSKKEVKVESVKPKIEFKVIHTENVEQFGQDIAKALEDGWKLGSFAVWSLSSNQNHWEYFQTLYK